MSGSVAVVITARPSYARLKTFLLALKARTEVAVIVGGSAPLERYGAVIDLIKQDLGPVAWTCYSGIEGETLETSARSTGLLAMDCAAAFRALQPSAVVVHADRHEVLGAALAARYAEIPLIHTQGGEQTGSIDDRVRDAITQLADCHLVSTPLAADRIRTMRGAEAVVTGCPSLDVALSASMLPPVDVDRLPGDGRPLDPHRPFVVVLQHPVTDHMALAYREMTATLEAIRTLGAQAVVLWPGDEAGMSAASKAIREHKRLNIRTIRNLPPETFLRLLMQSACLVGNSSVGIRECGFLGVPVVNIGDRQRGRERASNVLDCDAETASIVEAIKAQANKSFTRSELYGNGTAGVRMADAVLTFLRGGS